MIGQLGPTGPPGDQGPDGLPGLKGNYSLNLFLVLSKVQNMIFYVEISIVAQSDIRDSI